MSRKFGKFLLFSAVAGAAAYGAYRYLQNKETAPVSGKEDDTDDDFDDFSEDLDDDTCATKERAYVSLNLDKAEAFASEAFHKAKEVIADSVQQVKETVKSVTEGQTYPESSFTDLTDLRKSAEADSNASEYTGANADTAAADITDAPADSFAAADTTAGSYAAADITDAPADSFAAADTTDTDHSAPAVNAADANTPGETVEEFFDDEDV